MRDYCCGKGLWDVGTARYEAMQHPTTLTTNDGCLGLTCNFIPFENNNSDEMHGKDAGVMLLMATLSLNPDDQMPLFYSLKEL